MASEMMPLKKLRELMGILPKQVTERLCVPPPQLTGQGENGSDCQ